MKAKTLAIVFMPLFSAAAFAQSPTSRSTATTPSGRPAAVSPGGMATPGQAGKAPSNTSPAPDAMSKEKRAEFAKKVAEVKGAEKFFGEAAIRFSKANRKFQTNLDEFVKYVLASVDGAAQEGFFPPAGARALREILTTADKKLLREYLQPYLGSKQKNSPTTAAPGSPVSPTGVNAASPGTTRRSRPANAPNPN